MVGSPSRSRASASTSRARPASAAAPPAGARATRRVRRRAAAEASTGPSGGGPVEGEVGVAGGQGRLGGLDVGLGEDDVDLEGHARREVEGVAGGGGDDGVVVGLEQATERSAPCWPPPAAPDAQVGGRSLGPQHLGELLAGDGPPAVDGQGGEQEPRPAPADVGVGQLPPVERGAELARQLQRQGPTRAHLRILADPGVAGGCAAFVMVHPCGMGTGWQVGSSSSWAWRRGCWWGWGRPPARAATTLVVDRDADALPDPSNQCTAAPGDCSLRQAVDAAVDGDTITFEHLIDPEITLGQIVLTEDLTIDGEGGLNDGEPFLPNPRHPARRRPRQPHLRRHRRRRRRALRRDRPAGEAPAGEDGGAVRSRHAPARAGHGDQQPDDRRG